MRAPLHIGIETHNEIWYIGGVIYAVVLLQFILKCEPILIAALMRTWLYQIVNKETQNF